MAPAQDRKRVVKAPPLPVRPAFRREFLDFERGIRMGGLEPHERITQIVKHALVARHRRDFLIDKWGRGRYWQWICWLLREHRDAKPLSSGYNFGCAKFFISLRGDPRALQAGVQLERAGVRRGRGAAGEVFLQDDWDWHRLLAGLRKGTPLAAELERLVAREGFRVHLGGGAGERTFRGRRWGGVAALRPVLRRVPDDDWAWFQVYWPTPERELAALAGDEIVGSILAVFNELSGAMNLLMGEPYLAAGPARGC